METLMSQAMALTENSECLHSPADIERAVVRMATEITAKLRDKDPVFLCVVNGAIIFTGLLLIRLPFPLQLDYIHATQYHGKMNFGELKWIATPRIPLKDRVVVLLDDVLDTGITLAKTKEYCLAQGAAEVYVAVLVDKQRPREAGGLQQADFVGVVTENRFLYGSGLDYEEYLRNIPGIYAVKTS